MREAMGDLIHSSAIGPLLSRHGLIAKREESNRATIRHIPVIGKVTVYAFDRAKVGRKKLKIVGGTDQNNAGQDERAE